MSRRSTSIPPPLNDILQHILPSTDLFSNEIVLIVTSSPSPPAEQEIDDIENGIDDQYKQVGSSAQGDTPIKVISSGYYCRST